MKRILVIAITRMGDLIQSGPFLRRLKLRSPQAKIDLMVESCFTDVAALLPAVDEVIPIQIERVISCLEQGRSLNLATALANYRSDFGHLVERKYDEVWNLTHTKPAAALSYIVGGAHAQGVTWSPRGTQLVRAKWLHYFFAANLARPWCQFNLVDIYANCVSGIPWTAERALQLNGFKCADRRLLRPSPRPRIALHPGASTVTKQWSADAYASVAKRLLEQRNAEIILIGRVPERDPCRGLNSLDRVRDLRGRTTVRELAELLSDCDLLLTNDSGPMHVAAAVATPVLAVSVGSATAWETAPYGSGHIILESASAQLLKNGAQPSQATEAATITPEVLTQMSLAMIDHAPHQVLHRLAADADCDVYRTRFHETDSMLELQPLAQRQSRKSSLNLAFRLPWLATLEPRQFAPVVPCEFADSDIQNHAQLALAKLTAAKQIVAQIARELKAGPSPDAISLESQAAQLATLERAFVSELDQDDPLRSVLHFFQIGKGSLEAPDLNGQLAETASLYDTLGRLLAQLSPAPTQPPQNRTLTLKENDHAYHAERF
jgi:ADP-heptose:LPS heptosyltransferase